MPGSDCPSVLVNCSNGFVRENRSWVLGRLLRDHEIRHNLDPRLKEEGGRAESLRIDIFQLGPITSVRSDPVWWLGWATLVVQLVIVVIPWVLYGDWAIMLVTLAGIILVAITCAMPQWTEEKWAVPSKLDRDKVTCLTRGNGHLHIMVFIGAQGSWDMERLATRTPAPRSETRWISLVLAILWTCLLIAISCLKEHTWFLIGIGGLGMLQNVFAAGVSREPGASNFHLTKFRRAPTIIGRRQSYRDDADATVDLEEDMRGLADLNIWASEKPEPQFLGEKMNPCLRKRFPMPRWLTSMSIEDGIPGWLDTLKPDEVVKESGIKKKLSYFTSRICPLLTLTEDEPEKVIHAIGVHGALMELEK